MKYILTFVIYLFTLSSVTAQDTTCQKLMTLTARYGKKKLPVRTITKSSTSNYKMEIINQQDTSHNTHTITQFVMGELKKKVETILFDQKGYSRMDDGEWMKVDVGANNMMNTYMPTVNLPNQILENCKQFPSEKIGEQDCWVFETQQENTFPMNGQNIKIKSTNKLWINADGLAQKMVSGMNQNNTITILDSKFEYDENIKITAPIN